MTDRGEDKTARAGELLGLDRRDLLVRHAQGDRDAFRELVGWYRAEIFTYLVRAGVELTARDDIFQEVIISLHRSAARFDGSLPLRPWIYTITVNCVRSYHRKEQSRRNVIDGLCGDERSESVTPFEERVAAEMTGWLEERLLRLPLEQREVMLLHCVRGLEQKDIADILDLPVNTVKTHLRRARIALAAQLAEREQISETDSRKGEPV